LDLFCILHFIVVEFYEVKCEAICLAAEAHKQIWSDFHTLLLHFGLVFVRFWRAVAQPHEVTASFWSLLKANTRLFFPNSLSKCYWD